jgi:hypothetical protein
VLLPVQVVAAWLKRIAREVEVVAIQPAAEVLCLWRDPDQVVPPRPTQRHRRLVKEKIDVDRHVMQTAAALAPGDET